ncbi:fatty acyl-CoA synthetase [Spirillospora sp. NPDC046719]
MDDEPESRPPTVTRARRQSLGDIPRRTARRVPGKLALVDGDTRLTFKEFDDRIDRVAAALAEAGLGKGDRLAILSRNCWQYPVLVFAAARIGVVTVPVNFMLGGSEIAYILAHSAADALVAESALVPTATEALGVAGAAVRVRAALGLDGTAVPDGWADATAWADHPRSDPPDVDIGDDDLLRLMYTSGTESRPKGVMLGSRSLMWQYTSTIISGGMSADDVEVHALPFYHCAQLDNFLITDIYLGATSVILRGPDPDAILKAVDEERATKLFAPPTVWIGLLRSPRFDSADLGCLRKGYYGASAMPREVLRELSRRLPEVRLWNFYGQTEMAPIATALPPQDQLSHAGSAGLPALNVETLVVDDTDAPVPPGTVGEIVHRSPHAALGYLGAPDRTAEAFRGGWFHSGDLGYLDADGYLYVVDRKKDMIKTGGENVASREVEEVLYRHPDVAEAAVFGVDHPHWIEAVVAAVVPRGGARPSPEDIIAHCRAALAGFKTPKHVLIVDALPKNPSGKILKRRLRERFAHVATGELPPAP